MEKVLVISLKLNFTLNTLGCYGLKIKNLKAFVFFHQYSTNDIITRISNALCGRGMVGHCTVRYERRRRVVKRG